MEAATLRLMAAAIRPTLAERLDRACRQARTHPGREYWEIFQKLYEGYEQDRLMRVSTKYLTAVGKTILAADPAEWTYRWLKQFGVTAKSIPTHRGREKYEAVYLVLVPSAARDDGGARYVGSRSWPRKCLVAHADNFVNAVNGAPISTHKLYKSAAAINRGTTDQTLFIFKSFSGGISVLGEEPSSADLSPTMLSGAFDIGERATAQYCSCAPTRAEKHCGCGVGRGLSLDRSICRAGHRPHPAV
ncbi:hypothetical protein LTR53_003674 [Teratosphaeriaceae sp. CCFEE 6253]|nr:hypothetical protein LTR53_003674 [Teratosphaeriaceae sp. CCFEE 6253]